MEQLIPLPASQMIDIPEGRGVDEESAACLAANLEASDDAIMRESLDGIVLTWNGGAERMYGYAATEAVGQSIEIVVPEDRRAEFDALLVGVVRGQPVKNHDTVRRRKDGSAVDVSLTLAPIFERSGRVVGVSSFARDVSERKALVGALATALDEAQAAQARTHQFLSDAAHHLRTPITGISACAETLLRGCHPEEQERLLAEMVRQASRASVVIAQLLTIARVQDGNDLVAECCDVVDVCRQEFDRVRRCAPWAEIALVYDDSTRARVDGNASRRILATLLDNATRHAMSRIDVAVAKTEGTIELRVADNGPELPAALAEQLFDPFLTVESNGGSWLGLPLARALARAQAGDLYFDGGAFVLRLPASA